MCAVEEVKHIASVQLLGKSLHWCKAFRLTGSLFFPPSVFTEDMKRKQSLCFQQMGKNIILMLVSLKAAIKVFRRTKRTFFFSALNVNNADVKKREEAAKEHFASRSFSAKDERAFFFMESQRLSEHIRTPLCVLWCRIKWFLLALMTNLHQKYPVTYSHSVWTHSKL